MGLVPSARGAGLHICAGFGMEVRPVVVSCDHLRCLVLPRVSSQRVIMTILEYPKTEVLDIRNVDVFLIGAKTVVVERSFRFLRIFRKFTESGSVDSELMYSQMSLWM